MSARRGKAERTPLPPPRGDGRFAYDGLDRVMHEKARLGVLTCLVTHPKGLLFPDLKRACGLTDGNLSRHLTVLEEAGMVAITKGFVGKRPQTLCTLTAAGRQRFLDYISVLESVVEDAMETDRRGSGGGVPEGFSPA